MKFKEQIEEHTKNGTQNNPHHDAAQKQPKHGTQNNPHHDAAQKAPNTEPKTTHTTTKHKKHRTPWTWESRWDFN